MKNIAAFIILTLFFQSSFSQIDNCSKCDSIIYSKKDISHLSLLELKIIRNEIFARHQYVFKDERLGDYFIKKYDWYKPDYEAKKTIVLNEIEKENIKLFLKYENEKTIIKKTIIQELGKFKESLNKNETDKINSILNNVTQDFSAERKNALIYELKGILSKIDITEIHWHNENGLYKITTDDGYFLNETSITIKGKEIILSYNDIGHSELLSEETAFSFGSDYDSTNEYASWYMFTITNGKLTLLEHQAAG